MKTRNFFRTTLAVVALALAPHLPIQAQPFQELYAFVGISTNGSNPEGALVQGRDGNFYGTTSNGGQPTTNDPAGGYGTVFQITPDGVLTTLAWFNGTNNGANPFGSMIQATDGNFYGTSEYGIFRVTPSGVLTGRGGGIVGDPIQGSDGYLYYADGDTVYRSPLNGGAGMQWSAPGAPSGGLIQASDGNYYGLTSNGGSNDLGTAYRLTPQGVLTTVVSFGQDSTSPRFPYGRLLQASDGNLYGVSEGGGNGMIFRLTLDGVLTTMALCGSENDTPNGGLVEGNDGNLYGTSYQGDGYGSVFRMTKKGNLTALLYFGGYDTNFPNPGAYPSVGLAQGSDGNLYGTCPYGGSRGAGNVFRIIMPGPLLSPSQAAGQLTLSWRTNYVGYTLQSSPSLASGNWSDCTNPPAIVGGQFIVTNPVSGGAGYFRLKK